MIYLFIHQNFPGQYKNIVRVLASNAKNRVFFISQPNANEMVGVTKIVYTPVREENANCHPYAFEFDQAVRVGMGVVEACKLLKNQGIEPDVICGHAGWGEMLFVKDVFPKAPILSYFEFYYHMHNVDIDFDPEFSSRSVTPFGLRTRNAVTLLTFDAVDWGNTPTQWQQSVHPPELRSRLTVLHEGVDTDAVRPDAKARISLQRDGITLSKDDEIVTYVARNLEPYRGFHIMMRAACEILSRRPRARVLFVGGDEVSYGAPAPPGTSFRQIMLTELAGQMDMSRVHFLGKLPYEAYLKILQISSAHVYLTYPFVLSWSFVEAMSSGCAMIGSATPPVMEVLEHGQNGILVDFFSPTGVADAVDAILNHPDRALAMRRAARQTAVERFDLTRRILPLWDELLTDLMSGRRPKLHAKPARAR